MLLNTFFFPKSLIVFHNKYNCVTFLSKGLVKKNNKKWVRVDLFGQVGSLLLQPYKKTKRVLRRLRWTTLHVATFCCKANGFTFDIVLKRNGLLLYKNFFSLHVQTLASVNLPLQAGIFLRRVRGGIFFLFLSTICFLNFKLYKKLLHSTAILWKSARSFFFSNKIKAACTKATSRHVYRFGRLRRSVLMAKRKNRLKRSNYKNQALPVNKKLKRLTFYHNIVLNSLRTNCRFFKPTALEQFKV